MYVQGIEGKVDDQEHVCGDTGALLADKRCGDEEGANERRVEGRTSLVSRVDKVAGARSAIDGDRIANGRRGKNGYYYGNRKGGSCHVACGDDGGGLCWDASVKDGQSAEAFIPVGSYDKIRIQVAGSAACKEDLFARFVYSPPDR